MGRRGHHGIGEGIEGVLVGGWARVGRLARSGKVSRFNDNEDALLINRHYLPRFQGPAHLLLLLLPVRGIPRVEVTFNGRGLMGCRCAAGAPPTANCRGLLGDEALVWGSD